jgi:glycosyltransferase involved in cell wall biosynthesis
MTGSMAPVSADIARRRTDLPDVLFLMEQFRVGGLERMVLAQVTGLLDQGFGVSVALLIADRDNPLVTELDARAQLVSLPAGRLARLRVLAALARNRTVLIHLGKGRLYPSLRLALRHARKVVRFCHSDYAHLRSRWMNRLDRWVARTDTVIVAVGGRSAEFMRADVGVAAARIVTLPNVIPPLVRGGEAPMTLPRGRGAPRLVAVADLAPHKGQDLLIRSLPRILAQLPDAELVLIGDGDTVVALWRLARELSVLHRVTWLGAVWHPDLVRGVLRGCDLFVSMSRSEGIPVSVLEAAQLGLPMILSDIQGHRDGAGPSARYVPVEDDAGFAEAVIGCWRDPAGASMRSLATPDSAAWYAYLKELTSNLLA